MITVIHWMTLMVSPVTSLCSWLHMAARSRGILNFPGLEPLCAGARCQSSGAHAQRGTSGPGTPGTTANLR
ncbi:hypothetical protein GDO78_009884 [Eleutherodactylus coqui]|uniref:Secreted protein n=1 Tax=Eleutherodactylus coqui TaxID=57060 RepID=A0A8J6F9A3_ELECQ|nr:hypothetical protein GDO78_009884 [Eleutherodactylus coqui]